MTQIKDPRPPIPSIAFDHGTRPVPLDDLRRWSELLRLRDDDASRELAAQIARYLELPPL